MNDKHCFHVPAITKEEHTALRALAGGEADPYQQKLALQIIVNKFSRAHDVLYVPGAFDESAFLSGRGFVGQKILKCLTLPIGKLKQLEEPSNEQG